MSLQWRLIAYSDKAKEKCQSFGLQPGENRIGRSSQNEIKISSAKCSRHHCSIFVSNEQLFLIDCSRNGTFINGQRASNQQYFQLRQNDLISLDFDMTGDFDEDTPNAFIYSLICERTPYIEILESDDDLDIYKST